MNRLTDLKFLFRVVAVVEVLYAIAGVMPPSAVFPMTGWVLNADGHWVTKLLAMSLASQAAIAWMLRDAPHRRVAWALAFYQFASATTDWVMWVTMQDEGIFSNAQARIGVMLAVATHYLFGLLLVVALRRRPEAA